MLFYFRIDVASLKLLHLSSNSVSQIYLDSSLSGCWWVYVLKMTTLKAMQKVHLRKYNCGTVGVTRSVQHLHIHKENTSLSYSSFLELLKPQDTNVQEERRERISQVCSHYSNMRNYFESNWMLVEQTCRLLCVCFSLSFYRKTTLAISKESFVFQALPVFWQMLWFQNNCGNLSVQRL